MQPIILPKWKMVFEQQYDITNESEVNSRKLIDPPQPEESEYFSDHLPFNQTVLTTFRKLTIDFNSPYIELTVPEVLSICVGVKYRSSLGVVRTISATPNYFRKIEKTLTKYCYKVGQRFSLQPAMTPNGEIAPYQQLTGRGIHRLPPTRK